MIFLPININQSFIVDDKFNETDRRTLFIYFDDSINSNKFLPIIKDKLLSDKIVPKQTNIEIKDGVLIVYNITIWTLIKIRRIIKHLYIESESLKFKEIFKTI